MVNFNVVPLLRGLKALHSLSKCGYRGYIPREADMFTAPQIYFGMNLLDRKTVATLILERGTHVPFDAGKSRHQ